MNRTKIIATGVLMAAVATIIQGIPTFLSESFALLTLVSAIPVYTAARSNPLSGVIAYAATVLLLLFIDPGESLNFLLTNGVVGISQGLTSNFKLKKIPSLAASSGALTVTSSIMNFGIGTPVLGVALPGSALIQIIITLLISAGYNFGYQMAADFVYQKLQSSGITDMGSKEKEQPKD